MGRIIAAIVLLTISSFAFANEACSSPQIYTEGQYRYIISNGIDCSHGQFPNAHNPNTISAQSYRFRVPLNPSLSGMITPVRIMDFGVALNGVPFDPGTAEFWNNDPRSGWNYDAMTGFVNLGLDQNHAHVQPTGAYHYHGSPTDLIQSVRPGEMLLIGFAADGFPIYYKYGHQDAANDNSKIIALKPSYRLKTGSRPNPPGGIYSGAFTQDFEYIDGLGELDECNGVFGVSDEYPRGSYMYFVTDTYPFIPRCFKGTPDASFQKQPPQGGLRRGQFPGMRPPPPRQ